MESRDWGKEFRVWYLGFRVWSLGLGVQGLGFKVCEAARGAVKMLFLLLLSGFRADKLKAFIKTLNPVKTNFTPPTPRLNPKPPKSLKPYSLKPKPQRLRV